MTAVFTDSVLFKIQGQVSGIQRLQGKCYGLGYVEQAA
jgi:hypothetical protein